jgi:hypothetical protein
MNNKQTAVEWLIETIQKHIDAGYYFSPKFEEVIVGQAKEMEKKQIIDAWIDGNDSEPKETTGHYAEQYYTETFNN